MEMLRALTRNPRPRCRNGLPAAAALMRARIRALLFRSATLPAIRQKAAVRCVHGLGNSQVRLWADGVLHRLCCVGVQLRCALSPVVRPGGWLVVVALAVRCLG